MNRLTVTLLAGIFGTAGCQTTSTQADLPQVVTASSLARVQEDRPPLGAPYIIRTADFGSCIFGKIIDWTETIAAGQTMWVPKEETWTAPCSGNMK